MTRCTVYLTLRLVALVPIVGWTVQETATAAKDAALAARIEQLVDTFLTSDDGSKNASALSEARAIFEREGIPSLAKVGDAAAYGFVLINMLGQPPDFRLQFLGRVREAAIRRELPEDALAFAEARRRQTEIEERYAARTPSHPELRDQISRLFKDDQAVREKEGFDLKKMEKADRRTAGPLRTIFDRYGVPTYDMVGVQAAKDFVVMVQHQSPDLRLAVLPKLKANVDAGQADPGSFAMMYDRTQRDHGKNQLYGQQLECAGGKALDLAPIDNRHNVNIRRAELGLIRPRAIFEAHSPTFSRPVRGAEVDSHRIARSRRRGSDGLVGEACGVRRRALRSLTVALPRHSVSARQTHAEPGVNATRTDSAESSRRSSTARC